MSIILMLVCLVGLAYCHASGAIWSLVLGLGLLVAAGLGDWHGIFWVLGAAVWAAIVILIFQPSLRKRWLSQRIMTWYKSVLPSLSDTEQEALDAGDVSWEGELFTGSPDWERLMAYPKPSLTEEEQAFLDGPTEALCAKLSDWEISRELKDLPQEIWAELKSQGFFGMVIPKNYGGKGFSAQAHSAVVMKIATRSISAAVTVMVPNSLGPAELLLHYGTQAQRDQYLPKLATGEMMPCFGLTGPLAGSDAGAMTDTGVVCHGKWQGKSVLGLKLNWAKRYITLAPVADILGLAFKAYDPDGLLGENKDLGITCALVPTDLAGIKIGSRHLPLNAVFMNGPTWGEDVFIPFEFIIGGQEGIGLGWRMLMNCLSVGRSISLPALSAGAGKSVSMTTGAYAKIRSQFGTAIGEFEGVQEALVQIGGLTYLMDAARQFTAGLVDQGLKPAVPSAMLKYHNTEMMRTVVSHAMDVNAGRAVIDGPKNYIASMYMSLPISITVEGANILTRSMMIFGQGGVRCHPFVLKEMQALEASSEEAALSQFDQVFFEHMTADLEMAAKSLVLGIVGSRFLPAPDNAPVALKTYYQSLTHLSINFFIAADITMALLGGSLKLRESTSARLGDVFSYLYLATTALKHYEDQGREIEDLPLLEYALQHCLYQGQEALNDVCDNFPALGKSARLGVWVGRAIKVLLFPLGRRHTKPKDALQPEIARLLMSDSPARNRLVAGVYVNEGPQDAAGALEFTFKAVLAVAPIKERLRMAVKQKHLKKSEAQAPYRAAIEQAVISQAEADQLIAADKAVWDAIQVDDFTIEK